MCEVEKLIVGKLNNSWGQFNKTFTSVAVVLRL